MARFYFDTSAILERYHVEVGSAEVENIFADAGNSICTSRLALVEAYLAFSRRIREGEVTEIECAKVIAGLEGDIGWGAVKLLALSSKRLTDAISHFVSYGATAKLRTLDAIHITTALAAIHATGNLSFVAADRKHLPAAQAVGLFVTAVGLENYQSSPRTGARISVVFSETTDN